MGSILGALSRANATLGSATGAKLAVWECVALSRRIIFFLSLNLCDRQLPKQPQQKGKRKGREGGRGEMEESSWQEARREGW